MQNDSPRYVALPRSFDFLEWGLSMVDLR